MPFELLSWDIACTTTPAEWEWLGGFFGWLFAGCFVSLCKQALFLPWTEVFPRYFKWGLQLSTGLCIHALWRSGAGFEGLATFVFFALLAIPFLKDATEKWSHKFEQRDK